MWSCILWLVKQYRGEGPSQNYYLFRLVLKQVYFQVIDLIQRRRNFYIKVQISTRGWQFKFYWILFWAQIKWFCALSVLFRDLMEYNFHIFGTQMKMFNSGATDIFDVSNPSSPPRPGPDSSSPKSKKHFNLIQS